MIVIIGNKLDLVNERLVKYETANEKFKGLGLKYYELSAKSG
jgi:hypothetical protein